MTNRFIVNGLIEEAVQGKRVLYFTGYYREVREVLDEARRQFVPAGNITTANGREKIIAGRGHIDVRTATSVRSLRGSVYDLVYVDPEAERAVRDSDELIHNLRASVAATNGEIVRA